MIYKVIIFIITLYAFLFTGCTTPCGNEEMYVESSPDGSRKVVVFLRHCGVTTEYSTQLSILFSDDSLPNESGNVLIMSGSRLPTLKWKDDRVLSIKGIDNEEIFKQLDYFSGIKIVYD